MKNWQYIKFKDSITYIIGGDWGEEPNSANDSFVLSQVIRATDLKNWNLDRAKYAIIRKIDKFSLEKRQLRQGDIIFEISGGSTNQPVGRAILIDEKTISSVKYPIICGNFFRLIRFTKFLKSEFVNYYLRYAYLKGDIEQFQKNTTNIRNFQFSDFANNYTIPVPTISEQTQVVSILDEIFEKFETAKKQLAKIPHLLERYRQSVLERAVSGELTEDWREENNVEMQIQNVLMKDIAKVIDPNTSHRMPETVNFEGIPHIGSGDVDNKGIIKFDKAKLVSLTTLSEQNKRFSIDEGDIMYGRIGTIGKPAKLPIQKKYVLSYSVFLVKPLANIVNANFLYYYFLNQKFQNLVSSKKNASYPPSISIQNFNHLELQIPNIPEQTEIVNRVEKLLKKAEEAEAKYQAAMKMIDKLQASVLAMAFRGELSENQPNDEPVSELLEKIKTEKARLEQERKELQKSQTQIKRTMGKTISKKLDIYDILVQNPEKQMTVEEVFKASKHYPENKDKTTDIGLYVGLFYKELQKEFDNARIFTKSSEDGMQSYLFISQN